MRRAGKATGGKRRCRVLVTPASMGRPVSFPYYLSNCLYTDLIPTDIVFPVPPLLSSACCLPHPRSPHSPPPPLSPSPPPPFHPLPPSLPSPPSSTPYVVLLAL